MATDATILVVDDHPANLDIVTGYLSDAGYSVLVALDGHRGLERALRTRPDVILLDVKMPDPDGFEVCRMLRREPSLGNVPVIFMTALTDEESKRTAFEVGGVDYITKPVSRSELSGRVATHVEISRYRADLEREIERRTLEREQLIREVHHRVKNNLASMASLLRYELEEIGDGADARAALRASVDRIHVISEVHDSVYQGGALTEIRLGDLIAQIVNYLTANRSPVRHVTVDVASEAPPVRLADAVPLGIVINEMVTAVLDGSPSHPATVRATPVGRAVRIEAVGGAPGEPLTLSPLGKTLVAQIGSEVTTGPGVVAVEIRPGPE